MFHPIWGTDRLTNIDGLVFTGREPGVDGLLLGDFEFIAVSDIIFNTALPPQSSPDIAGDASTTATIAIGETVNSDIGPAGDSDWFAITIEAGQTVRLSQSADNPFRRDYDLVDSEGNILAGRGIFIVNNPEREDDFFFTADETAVYFLVLASAETFGVTPAFGEGTYSLTATEVIDLHGDTRFDAAEIAGDGTAVTGSIGTVGDRDNFAFEVNEGDSISISLDGLVTDADRPLLAFNIIVIDSNGNQLPGTSVRDRHNSLDFIAEASGVFTVQVQGFIGQGISRLDFTGDYELTVTNTPLIINTIEGTAADDIVSGTSGADDIFGFEGDDVLNGRGGQDALFGAEGNDTLIGGAGVDNLFGGDGNDILSGGADDDGLFGGAGNDRLSGGSGNDLLTGGNGSDIFRFRRFTGGESHDVITDFEDGVDVISFVNFDFTSFEDLFITFNDNGYVAIFLSEDRSITFEGLTDISVLDASDFTF